MSDHLIGEDEGRGREILALLFQLATGRAKLSTPADDPEGKFFFQGLIRFQQMLERQGRQAVTRPAIRLWSKGSVPRRGRAIEFLDQYLSWIKVQKMKAGIWNAELEQIFENASRIIETVKANGQAPAISRNLENSPSLPQLDPAIAVAMQGLLGISKSTSSYSESEAFSTIQRERAIRMLATISYIDIPQMA